MKKLKILLLILFLVSSANQTFAISPPKKKCIPSNATIKLTNNCGGFLAPPMWISLVRADTFSITCCYGAGPNWISPGDSKIYHLPSGCSVNLLGAGTVHKVKIRDGLNMELKGSFWGKCSLITN